MLEAKTNETTLSAGKQTFVQSKEQQKAVRTLQRKVTQIEEELATIEERSSNWNKT